MNQIEKNEIELIKSTKTNYICLKICWLFVISNKTQIKTIGTDVS